MEDRAVAVVAAQQVPRPLRVDALVVVERAGAEVPEAERDGEREDRDADDDRPVESDAKREEPFERLNFGLRRQASSRHSPSPLALKYTFTASGVMTRVFRFVTQRR